MIKKQSVMENYSLYTIRGQVSKYKVIAPKLNTASAWESTYKVISVGRSNAVDTVRLACDPPARELRIQYTKSTVDEHVLIEKAVINYGEDTLSYPKTWRYESACMIGGSVLPGTRGEKSGRIERNEIIITNGKSDIRHPVSGIVSMDWLLVESIQRMKNSKIDPVDFDLIDHFDQIKRQYSLTYRETIETDLGTNDNPATKRLTSYFVHGRGNLPTVYWADSDGRVLFITAGFESYVLETAL